MGGPIFPLLFIGGTLGQALSGVLTFIPQGVGVLAGMAGAACAFLPIPLTMALLLGLFGGQTDLIPVIVIGAVTGFIISKAFTHCFRNILHSQPAAVNNDNGDSQSLNILATIL